MDDIKTVDEIGVSTKRKRSSFTKQLSICKQRNRIDNGGPIRTEVHQCWPQMVNLHRKRSIL